MIDAHLLCVTSCVLTSYLLYRATLVYLD